MLHFMMHSNAQRLHKYWRRCVIIICITSSDANVMMGVQYLWCHRLWCHEQRILHCSTHTTSTSLQTLPSQLSCELQSDHMIVMWESCDYRRHLKEHHSSIPMDEKELDNLTDKQTIQGTLQCNSETSCKICHTCGMTRRSHTEWILVVRRN